MAEKAVVARAAATVVGMVEAVRVGVWVVVVMAVAKAAVVMVVETVAAAMEGG